MHAVFSRFRNGVEGKGKAVNILGQGGIRFNTVPYSGDMCWYVPVLGAILYPYTAVLGNTPPEDREIS